MYELDFLIFIIDDDDIWWYLVCLWSWIFRIQVRVLWEVNLYIILENIYNIFFYIRIKGQSILFELSSIKFLRLFSVDIMHLFFENIASHMFYH